MSTTSNAQQPESLGSSLKRCRAHAIQYKGQNGHFVSTARLDNIETSIHEMCEAMDKTPASQEKYNAMLEEVETLRREAAVAEAALVAAKTEAIAAQKSYKEYKAMVDPVIIRSAKTQDDLKAQKAELASQLKDAQEINNAAKKASRVADKGFDPEVALKARAEKDAALANLQEVQRELEHTNKALESLHKEKDTMSKEIELRRKKQQELENIVSTMQATRVEAMGDIPVRKVDVQINSPALKLLLGDKGLDWVKKAAEAHEIEIREKVFNMMNALKGHKNNRVINGLFGLLQVAFQWIKTQSYKARMALQPWVAQIEEDLRKGIFKQLSFYRQELEKVIGSLKEKAKKVHEESRERFKHSKKTFFGFFSLWDETVAWARVLRNRSKRIVNNVTKVVSTYFASWFKAKPGEHVPADFTPIKLFDYEDGLPEVSSVPAPPPAPPGVGSSSRN